MPTPWGPLQIDPPKINFFELLKLGCQFVLISADMLQTNIWHIWGCLLPGTPPNRPLENQFFEWLKLGCSFVLISADILQTNILT